MFICVNIMIHRRILVQNLLKCFALLLWSTVAATQLEALSKMSSSIVAVASIRVDNVQMKI